MNALNFGHRRLREYYGFGIGLLIQTQPPKASLFGSTDEGQSKLDIIGFKHR
jgi:hypothetical protein